MPTIDVLTERVVPVTATTMVSAVFMRFQQEPDTLVLPVVDGDRPLGLIDRSDFLMKLAAPLGHSLYGSREVIHIMDPEPAVVEGSVRIDAFSDIILKSRAGALMRGFIVTRNGAYRGIGTAISLLRAVNEIQRDQLMEQSTQIKQLSEDHKQVQAAAHASGQFIDMLNRELRTPMNGILAVADLLLRQPLNDAAQAYVQTILDSSETLISTLQDSLDLARAEAGELRLNQNPASLQQVMDDVQNHWAPRAAEDGVSLIVSYDGASKQAALIDAPRLTQVFNALIGQSLKYTRSGMVEVSLKAREQAQYLHLEARVRDDGPGISPETIENLFQQSHQSQAGTLPLTISQHIVQQMDGSIWAKNNQGNGATYGFDIKVQPAELESPDSSNVTSLKELELNTHPHVLIADDNATNRVVAQALCEMFGCTSETVEDGQEALDAVRNRPFDLVLMDIKMPRLDGVQATLAIRQLNIPARSIPIIALTANADPDDAQHYLSVGMAAVVEKPIKPERLRLAMNAALTAATDTDQDISPVRLRG